MAEQQFNPGVSLAGAVDLEALKHQVKAEPGQAGGAPAAGGYVIDTTENTFQAMVQTSATFPILLLLWVPTDDRLFPMARALGDAVNALNGQIQLSRIDISSNPSIAQALQVQGVPALFALIAGRPMPLLQGLPGDDELKQLTDEVIPKIIEAAAQSGVNGTAPYSGDPDSDAAKSAGATGAVAGAEQVPPEHAEAHRLAEEGDYACLLYTSPSPRDSVPPPNTSACSNPTRPMHWPPANVRRRCCWPAPGPMMYVTCVPLPPQRRTMWKRSWLWLIST